MKRLVLALAALLATAAEAQTPGAPFRIARLAETAGPCGPLPAEAPKGERAYYDLLAERLDQVVEACPVTDLSAAAAALAEGAVDLAPLDGEAYAPVAGQVRAILSLLSESGLNRTAVRVAVRADSSYRSLADLAGRPVVFGGRLRAHYDAPKAALADYGAGEGFFGPETIAVDHEDAAARLRSGSAEALVLHVGAWQRLCRGDAPGVDLCADLRPVWTQRPRATRALAVRKDMEQTLRHRLVGIHVAMHLEAPEAFAGAIWRAGAAEFEPAEAEALVLRERPVA